MLISFAVENHRSIRERQILNLEATSDDHLAESRVIEADGVRILRSAAIYGPNASGKSNLVDAMTTMRRLVLASSPSAQVNRKIAVDPFRLSSESEKAPSEFQVEFLLEGNRYRYGFQAEATAIRTEWLKRKGKGKEATLFTRDGQEIEVNSEQFREGMDRKQFMLPNSLFLSLCAQLNGEISGKVLGWFQHWRFVSGLSDTSILAYTAKRIQDPKQNATLVTFAKHADLSICGLSGKDGTVPDLELPKNMPDEDRERILREIAMSNTEIKTSHPQYGPDGNEVGTVEFDLKKDESEGTRKFIALSGPLHHTVEDSAVLVVDEFEARLHPLLTQAIIDWFHSPLNPSRAQLIVATHDVLLMEPERIRRDQVWFCEKDDKGATELYCLAEFDPQNVRPTTKFSRQYLLGVFGAVPRVALMKGDPVHA